MKRQNKLTFASMLTVTGAMIGLTNCGVYGPPEDPMPGVYGAPEYFEINEEDTNAPIDPVYGPPEFFGIEDDINEPVMDVYGPPEFFEDDDTHHNGAVDESGSLYEYYSEDGSVFIRQDYDTNTSVIMDGEEGIPVDIAMGIYGPRIEKTDIDGDGEDEYVIAECENTGTGISIYGLCIVQKDGDEYTLTRYDGEYFAEIINNRVKYSYDRDAHEITVTAKNDDGEVTFTNVIERSYSDEYELNEVVWHDIIRIRLIDGKPYLSACSGYIFVDAPMPDFEDSVEVSAPIIVNGDSSIEVGDFALGEDNGNKIP